MKKPNSEIKTYVFEKITVESQYQYFNPVGANGKNPRDGWYFRILQNGSDEHERWRKHPGGEVTAEKAADMAANVVRMKISIPS